MDPNQLVINRSYAGNRWKGDRKVVRIDRPRHSEPIVHYIDLRTGRTGHALATTFAENVSGPGAVTNVQHQGKGNVEYAYSRKKPEYI